MLLAAMLFVSQKALEVPVIGPEPCRFSAIPVCGAGHHACRGRATLHLPTEYGPVAIDARDVVCGERFVLSARNAPIVQRQYEELAVELALEGHDPVTLRELPMHYGCDVGPWRVAAAASMTPAPAPPVQPMGPRSLRVELRGEPTDAITGFTIPDVETPSGMCGLGHRPICSPSFGVRRVDRRTWELDLDALNVRLTRFSVFVDTLSGSSVESLLEEVPRTAFGVRSITVTAPVADKSLHGRVVDSRDSPVPDACLWVTPLATDTVRLVRTDGEGRFELAGLGDCRVWLRVDDPRWRDVNPTGRFATPSNPPGAEVRIVVARQRSIEIDARELHTGALVGFVACLRPLTPQGDARFPSLSVHVDPAMANAPFRIPANGHDRFEVSLVPMPAEGRVHDGAYEPWVTEARIASRRIIFPKDSPAGAVRRWRFSAR